MAYPEFSNWGRKRRQTYPTYSGYQTPDSRSGGYNTIPYNPSETSPGGNTYYASNPNMRVNAQETAPQGNWYQQTAPTPDAPNKPPETAPRESSDWNTAANVINAGAGAVNAYAAYENLDKTQQNLDLSKDVANKNFQAQSGVLGTEIGNREYVRWRNRGASEEEANAKAAQAVANANLPTNLNGKSFQWTRS